MISLAPYFTILEIACKCCGEAKIMDSFAARLVELREAWGRPMVINSCCRCSKHNKAIGGAAKSFHMFGQKNINGVDATIAVDVSTKGMTGGDRYKLALLAMQKGWSVGVAKTFLHFDRRSDYPETGWENPVLFTY